MEMFGNDGRVEISLPFDGVFDKNSKIHIDQPWLTQFGSMAKCAKSPNQLPKKSTFKDF
jgi:hypothetical protein